MPAKGEDVGGVGREEGFARLEPRRCTFMVGPLALAFVLVASPLEAMAQADPTPASDAEPDPGPGPDSSRAPDAGSGSDSGPAPDADSGSDSGSDSGPAPATDSASAPATDSVRAPDADAGPVPDPDPGPPPEPASAPDPVLSGAPADRLGEPTPTLPSDGVWVLDDGLGPELPWDDFNLEEQYGPPGLAHFGVQLRGAGLAEADAPTPAGPLFEAALFFDLRYSERGPMRFRIVAAMTLQNTGKTALGDYSNLFSMRFRVMPLAIDITRWVAFRVGAGFSFFWADLPAGGAFQVYPDATGEVTVQTFGGRLELGVFASLHQTAVTRPSARFGQVSGDVQAAIGVSVGYLLQ